MLLAFLDECNPEPNNQHSPENRFLIFGVTLIDSSVSLEFNEGVDEIRQQHGFNRTDKLKYALADKPDHVTNEQHREAKAAVLELAARLNVKTILYCALHRIIDSQGQDTYLNWGMDACLTKIQQFYTENEAENGFFCFFDRHSRQTMPQYMKTKFQERNHQPRAGHRTPNLVGVSQVWDGTSHLSSLCDIVTGSYAYVVSNPDRDIAGKSLVRLLKPMVWGISVDDGQFDVMDRGLLFRPEQRNPRFDVHYEEVRSRVVDWANEPA